MVVRRKHQVPREKHAANFVDLIVVARCRKESGYSMKVEMEVDEVRAGK